MSNPWTADGDTTFENLAVQHMSNGSFSFGAVSAANGYDGTGDYGLLDHGTLIWSTRTSGGSNNRLVMQRDGNLVVYNGTASIWQSGTSGNPGARLVLQADRNLVIYSATGKALWQSGTNT